MRKKKSIKNIIGSFSQNIIVILVGIISQAIFIKQLGLEYLGLNGLFTNIISMLGIIELGIGSAIIYNLYKPISENNIESIKSLMKFYKKSYNIIAFIVLFIGILISPFLSKIVGDIDINVNLKLIYILFILDVFFSYIMSYKRSILYASQNNYIVNIVHIIYIISMNSFQIIILVLFKNYIAYLVIKIIFRIFENLLISIIANKKYPFLTEKNVVKLDAKVHNDIVLKIKSLFFHQIGGFIVNSTDNILISKFFSISMVGLYSNYNLIIVSIEKLFGQFIESLTPSIGNLLVSSSEEKIVDIFKKIRFLNFCIASFCGVCLVVLTKDFISLWIGEKYILSNLILCVLVLNFHQKMMKKTYSSFKTAAGIFHEDRFVPVIESILNILFSIVLLKAFGLAGVFMGTMVSSMCLWLYSYPKFIYKGILKRDYISYIKETIGYLILFIILCIITMTISEIVDCGILVLNLFIKLIVCVIITFTFIIIIFRNNENYIYYKNEALNIMFKKNRNKES